MEDVADAGAPTQLRRLDVARRALDGRAVRRRKLCDDLEQCLALRAGRKRPPLQDADRTSFQVS